MTHRLSMYICRRQWAALYDAPACARSPRITSISPRFSLRLVGTSKAPFGYCQTCSSVSSSVAQRTTNGKLEYSMPWRWPTGAESACLGCTGPPGSECIF